jgi:hypothetical protein
MPGNHYGQWLTAGTPVAVAVVAAAARAAAALVVHATGPLVHLPPSSVVGAGSPCFRSFIIFAAASALVSLVSLGLTIFASS